MVSILEMKRYMKTRSFLTESELAIHFKTTEEMVRVMLERLEQKGEVKQEIHKSACPFNCGCGGESKKLWKFVG